MGVPAGNVAKGRLMACRLDLCCAVIGALFAAGSVSNTALASSGADVCRNQIAINSWRIAGPNLILRSGNGRGNCRRDPAARGNGIEPRLIVSGADVYVDVSVADFALTGPNAARLMASAVTA
jgi:hypothetical protein